MQRLTLSSAIERNNEILATAIDGEFVMMSIDTGKYYGLNSVGSRIWELIAQPTSVESVCKTLLGEFSVEKQKCEKEVLDILQQMFQKNLVVVK